jgi:hypothetical protein
MIAKIRREQCKAGDEIIVRVGGKDYKTVIDRWGVQLFKGNTLLTHLYETRKIDLNSLAADYQKGKFSKEEYLEFYIGIGCSVSRITGHDSFKDVQIENPLID